MNYRYNFVRFLGKHIDEFEDFTAGYLTRKLEYKGFYRDISIVAGLYYIGNNTYNFLTTEILQDEGTYLLYNESEAFWIYRGTPAYIHLYNDRLQIYNEIDPRVLTANLCYIYLDGIYKDPTILGEATRLGGYRFLQ